MGLLSNQDKLEIRAAIKATTDTFMVTPMKYRRLRNSFDLYNEDMTPEDFVEITLHGLVEFDLKDKVIPGYQGDIDNFDVMVTFNMEDMIAQGLVDSNLKSLFIAGSDTFKIKSETYSVEFVGYDGPLDAQECLIVISGKKNTNIKNDG